MDFNHEMANIIIELGKLRSMLIDQEPEVKTQFVRTENKTIGFFKELQEFLKRLRVGHSEFKKFFDDLTDQDNPEPPLSGGGRPSCLLPMPLDYLSDIMFLVRIQGFEPSFTYHLCYTAIKSCHQHDINLMAFPFSYEFNIIQPTQLSAYLLNKPAHCLTTHSPSRYQV